MEVRNCAKCGKIFQYVLGPPICSACKQKEDDSFQTVKEYIYDNRNANMMDVSNDTNVPIKLIERFLREGRLELSSDSPIYLKCEKCDKEIKTGRYCQVCSTSLSNEMRMSVKADAIPSRIDGPNKNKMHFLNKDNIR